MSIAISVFINIYGRLIEQFLFLGLEFERLIKEVPLFSSML